MDAAAVTFRTGVFDRREPVAGHFRRTHVPLFAAVCGGVVRNAEGRDRPDFLAAPAIPA